MNVLVTGAAGYIGSVIVAELVHNGHTVVALDNLSLGHKAAVHPKATFVHADLSEYTQVHQVFSTGKIDAVIHLAGESLVGESMRNPGKFFQANILNGLNLLEAMRHNDVKKIVFSSTAAVYGEPEYIPIDESHPTVPINYYGFTKLTIEAVLQWYSKIHEIKYFFDNNILLQ